MQTGRDFAFQQFVDCPVTFDSALATKRFRLDDEADMRRLARNRTRMAGMQAAFIDNLQPRRRQGVCDGISYSVNRTHIERLTSLRPLVNETASTSCNRQASVPCAASISGSYSGDENRLSAVRPHPRQTHPPETVAARGRQLR